MTALHYLTLTDLAALLRTRDLSPVEVTRAQLERINVLDRRLGSYALVVADRAIADARHAEQEIVAGRYRGPLHGVPLGVKDLLWTQGIPTAAGMPLHATFSPGRDATVATRLRTASAVILGKQQMTEGAYSDYHPSIAPPETRGTRISSSGPTVATAAGLCYGTLASDTGGSIRWPCAATGLTPQVGGRSGIKAMRVGIDRAWNTDDVHASVAGALADAAATLRRLGGEIVEWIAPDCRQTVTDWPALCAVEAYVAHQATFPGRRSECGPVLDAGRAVDGAQLHQIELRRLTLRGRFARLFNSVDILLSPVHPFPPLTLDDIQTLGEHPDLIAKLQRYTAPSNRGPGQARASATAGSASRAAGLTFTTCTVWSARTSRKSGTCRRTRPPACARSRNGWAAIAVTPGSKSATSRRASSRRLS
jgi:amidase